MWRGHDPLQARYSIVVTSSYKFLTRSRAAFHLSSLFVNCLDRSKHCHRTPSSIMNTPNGSIQPVIKALVAGFSLTMMSALVWYSHIQAQPNSPDGQVAKQEIAKSNATVTPPPPSIPSVPLPTDGTLQLENQSLNTIDPSAKTSGTLFLLGSMKYYTGLSTVIAGSLNAPAKSSDAIDVAEPSQTKTIVDASILPQLPAIPSVPLTSVDTINPRISIITVVDPSSTYESHQPPLGSFTWYIYEPFKLSDPITPLIKVQSKSPNQAAEH